MSLFSAGVFESWSGLRRGHRASETEPAVVGNEEGFLCCLWGEDNMDCSLYRASMQARKLIPSEISVSASQEIGRFSFQDHKSYLFIKKWLEFIVWEEGMGCINGYLFYPEQKTKYGQILPGISL